MVKETILGAMITELVRILGTSMTEFLSKYECLLGKYVDYHALRALIENLEPAENWEIIQKAKILALGSYNVERDSFNHTLCSVFSNLSLDGSYPAKKYYAPGVLDIQHIMPYSEVKNYNCDSLFQDFNNELELCMHSSPKDFDSFLIVMDTLLKKYFWNIPASEKKDEDISFYVYIRTVTAIISVLMQKPQKDTPYMMVAGHFSGIQRYIFSVSKVGTGGVAKRLRARSFYVNAMVSALAHCIVHKFRLPMVNILMLTGGKFYILLPNTEETIGKLQKIEQQITAFLYEKFKGNLSLELVWEEIADNGLYNYNETVSILSRKIEKKKLRLLESVLINEKEWNTEKFVIYQDLSHKSMCKACRNALVDEGKEMCSNCEIDTEIGGRLPKVKAFSFSRKKGQYKLLNDYYLNLDISAGGEQNYLIMQLNDSNLTDIYDRPVTIHYATNDVPLQITGDVKTFGEIANEAQGSKQLGILKADVDTLGFLFSEGLKGMDNEKISISRVNTLSCMLDLFFGGYLHYLLKNKYQNIYCVFSGGDDLFLIGPWNDMPALAIDLNNRFHEYTGNNPCMTLSAAICMAESGGHISTLAEHCEKNLEQVKQEADHIISPGRPGRNGIYFLGKLMTWEDFQEQIASGKEFARIYTKIGSGILRRLAIYSNMYQEYLKDRDTTKLIFLPLFSNDLMRNSETFKKLPDFQIYCTELYKKASNYRKVEKQFYYLEFCIRYAFQLTKEDRKNG
ncbi:MAG: type III-A CRISPR-associated protein Cas10/Csm1 [Hungatella sp.]|nr:type III-A CRISPR-associated protein Cas10/Csm1 [Hungatella sp.]